MDMEYRDVPTGIKEILKKPDIIEIGKTKTVIYWHQKRSFISIHFNLSYMYASQSSRDAVKKEK